MNALDRYWLAPGSALRLATVRLLVGAFCVIYLLARVHVLADFSSFSPAQFEPVGPVALLDGPIPAALVWLLWAAAVITGAMFALGYRYTLSGPAFGLLFLWVTSYRNSWGMIFHTDNLVLAHALCLGLCPAAADTLSLDHRGQPAPEDHGRYGWPIKLVSAVTVVAYLLAGVAKVKNTGWHWAEGDILRNYIAYDAMRKLALGSIHSPFGAWLVQRAWPFPALSVMTFVVELGAPLAMVHRRAGELWVVGIYGFHVGVLAMMAIAFPYPISGIAFASFLPCERIWRLRPLKPLAAWLR